MASLSKEGSRRRLESGGRGERAPSVTRPGSAVSTRKNPDERGLQLLLQPLGSPLIALCRSQTRPKLDRYRASNGSLPQGVEAGCSPRLRHRVLLMQDEFRLSDRNNGSALPLPLAGRAIAYD